ncbi:unnamed protein product [Symbiodinium natans]|uniref:Uncharacterized protein n=2 Tax=Symbiodinium natans TaxID=878477 RepID=A0A812MA40_9DINO|nr:unnamed protein product [Symbiodinium natans]
MGLAIDATAQRLLQQLLHAEPNEASGTSRAPLSCEEVALTDAVKPPEENPPPGEPSKEVSHDVMPAATLDTLFQKVASLEQKICKLLGQYFVAPATSAKKQSKVKRKRFLTSCSTSPKTAWKKQKVQEMLSPRCIEDEHVRRNLDCEFFHVGDEEAVDDQQDHQKDHQDVWGLDWGAFEPVHVLSDPCNSSDSSATANKAQQDVQSSLGDGGLEDAISSQSLPRSFSAEETCATACAECPLAGPGEWDPYKLLLPGLLPYLDVDDLKNWRQASQHTRSPKVLLEHVAEIGSMARSEAVLTYWDSCKLFVRYRFSAFGADAERRKHFDCCRWCMEVLVKKTHFAAADVHRIVGKNIRDLLQHCRHADASLCKAAHITLENAMFKGCFPFARQLIAEGMLGLMEEFLSDPTDICDLTLTQVLNCASHFRTVLRSLSKLQRQQWASLLVRTLHLRPKQLQQKLVEDLQILWRTDDDPSRTFAEEERQLRIFYKTVSSDLEPKLAELIWQC